MATSPVDAKRGVTHARNAGPQRRKDEARARGHPAKTEQVKIQASTARSKGLGGKGMSPKRSAVVSTDAKRAEQRANKAHGFVGGSAGTFLAPRMDFPMGGPAFVANVSGFLRRYFGVNGNEPNQGNDSDDRTPLTVDTPHEKNVADNPTEDTGKTQRLKTPLQRRFLKLANEAAAARLEVTKIENGEGQASGLTRARIVSSSTTVNFTDEFKNLFEIDRSRPRMSDKQPLSNRHYKKLVDAQTLLEQLLANTEDELAEAVKRAGSEFNGALTKTVPGEIITGVQRGRTLANEVIRLRHRHQLLSQHLEHVLKLLD